MRIPLLLAVALLFSGCAAPKTESVDPGVPAHVLDCDYTLDGVPLDCDSAIAQANLGAEVPAGWRCVSNDFPGTYATYWHEDGRVGILFTPFQGGDFANARFWGRMGLHEEGPELEDAWFTTQTSAFFLPFNHVAVAGDSGKLSIGLHPMTHVDGEVPEATLESIQVLGIPVGDRVAPILKVPSDPARHYLPVMFDVPGEPSLGWSNLEITRGDILEFSFKGGQYLGESNWRIPQDIAVQELLGNDPCA